MNFSRFTEYKSNNRNNSHSTYTHKTWIGVGTVGLLGMLAMYGDEEQKVAMADESDKRESTLDEMKKRQEEIASWRLWERWERYDALRQESYDWQQKGPVAKFFEFYKSLFQQLASSGDGVMRERWMDDDQPLFPPKTPDLLRKHTLIIDWRCLMMATYSAKHGMLFTKRPGVDMFMMDLSHRYEIIISYDADRKVGRELVDRVDPMGRATGRMFRQQLVYKDGVFYKPMTRVNRDLSKVIVMDTRPSVSEDFQDNLLLMKRWGADVNRNASDLIDVVPFLMQVANHGYTDVRDILRSYRDAKIYIPERWRSIADAERTSYELYQSALAQQMVNAENEQDTVDITRLSQQPQPLPEQVLSVPVFLNDLGKRIGHEKLQGIIMEAKEEARERRRASSRELKPNQLQAPDYYDDFDDFPWKNGKTKVPPAFPKSRFQKTPAPTKFRDPFEHLKK